MLLALLHGLKVSTLLSSRAWCAVCGVTVLEDVCYLLAVPQQQHRHQQQHCCGSSCRCRRRRRSSSSSSSSSSSALCCMAAEDTLLDLPYLPITVICSHHEWYATFQLGFQNSFLTSITCILAFFYMPLSAVPLYKFYLCRNVHVLALCMLLTLRKNGHDTFNSMHEPDTFHYGHSTMPTCQLHLVVPAS
jgi:hypothetical protein